MPHSCGSYLYTRLEFRMLRWCGTLSYFQSIKNLWMTDTHHYLHHSVVIIQYEFWFRFNCLNHTGSLILKTDRGLQYPSAHKIVFSDHVLIYWLNLSYFEKQQWVMNSTCWLVWVVVKLWFSFLSNLFLTEWERFMTLDISIIPRLNFVSQKNDRNIIST